MANVDEALSADEQIRLACLKMIVTHYEGARIDGIYLRPDHLIARATKLEEYVRNGKEKPVEKVDPYARAW